MPAVSEHEIAVEGFAGLQRAFKAADRTLANELRKTLREVAEPVKESAQDLALAEISHIGIPWSRMRIGITKTSVYVAPKQRGIKTRGENSRKRPNLAPLLLDVEETAVEMNTQEVIDGVDQMLLLAGVAWERA